jgi:primosomal protein N' (replication factor Y)
MKSPEFVQDSVNETQKVMVKVAIVGNVPEPYTYHVPTTLLTQFNIPGISVGMVVEVPLRSKQVLGICIEVLSKKKEVTFKTKPLTRVLCPQNKLSTEWLDLLNWISSYYHCTLSKTLSAALPKTAIQLLLYPEKRIAATSLSNKEKTERLTLTQEQHAAIEIVYQKSNSLKNFSSFLLHGITGSGKTLVYLYLIRKCIQQGKNALVLLPEISLTPQTLQQFISFLTLEFGDDFAEKIHLFHSNLSAKKRKQTWTALLEKQVRILIGVRSAVLAPLHNIGLIIVDEEHDSSYKQSEIDPRYHGRDVALYRGQKLSCPVLLGSATPSLESYHAAIQGKHHLLTLTERPKTGFPPEITLVDMKEQWKLQGDAPISIPLRDALNKAMNQGEQAILLLNRRGYAKRRICENCGNTQECPNCLIPLIPHRKNIQGHHNPQLICHHCNYVESIDVSCNKCGHPKYLEVGLAIEQLEDKLAQWYPNKKVLRMDRDTTGRVGSLEKLLQTFRKKEADILLGTQMVAKGHDFPNVNLVGVIEGDMGLGTPDFRAQERVFQLVVQVAGRAGRHSQQGHVYIQTYQPENPTLKQALSSKVDAYQQFYQEEFEQRKKLFYPPLSKVFKIEFSSTKEDFVQEHTRIYFHFLKPYTDKINVPLLGPSFASYRKIGGFFRCQIFGRGSSTRQMHWAITESFKDYKKRYPKEAQRIKIHIDMDPVSVL